MAAPKKDAAPKAPKPEYLEHEIRASALGLALVAKKFKDETDDVTVTRAETFLTFLRAKPIGV